MTSDTADTDHDAPWFNGLTTKQRRFVEEYCIDWNATQAAIRAGYSKDSARTSGGRNMHNDVIRAALEGRFRDLAMSSDEALARLRDLANQGEDTVKLSALDKILRAHGAYKDRVDLTSGDKEITGVVFTRPGQPE
jgi:Terminase small subunit